MLRLESLKFNYSPTKAEQENEVIKYGFTKVIKGPITELRGVSGIGKTSLLMAISGHMQTDSGEIYWHNKPLSSLKSTDRSTAILFQDAKNFPDIDVIKNIAIGINGKLQLDRKERGEILNALEKIGLKDKSLSLAKKLSVGEGRKVAFLRTIFKSRRFRYPLILLDEPLAGLDAESQKMMLAILLAEVKSKSGSGAIIASHQTIATKIVNEKITIIKKDNFRYLA